MVGVTSMSGFYETLTLIGYGSRCFLLPGQDGSVGSGRGRAVRVRARARSFRRLQRPVRRCLVDRVRATLHYAIKSVHASFEQIFDTL